MGGGFDMKSDKGKRKWLWDFIDPVRPGENIASSSTLLQGFSFGLSLKNKAEEEVAEPEVSISGAQIVRRSETLGFKTNGTLKNRAVGWWQFGPGPMGQPAAR
ncbi:hypothetical protein PanWU01x14_357350 [Parasponia andersonii]|uniref:Uncharacterized protein n=1 Tax=Parasponia andersonii TaxID=3476 RepID=A0A2P5A8K5_PARAD|nr:hypothetical protein PanWU01x14_357350 [Parasponia andersonii]